MDTVLFVSPIKIVAALICSVPPFVDEERKLVIGFLNTVIAALLGADEVGSDLYTVEIVFVNKLLLVFVWFI